MDNSHIKPERNPKILKDLLRTEWLQEIKEEELVGNYINKLLKWQVKSKKYYKKKVHHIIRSVLEVVLPKKRQQLGRV